MQELDENFILFIYLYFIYIHCDELFFVFFSFFLLAGGPGITPQPSGEYIYFYIYIQTIQKIKIVFRIHVSAYRTS